MTSKKYIAWFKNIKLDFFYFMLIPLCVLGIATSSVSIVFYFSEIHKMRTIIHEDKSTIDSLMIMEKHHVNKINLLKEELEHSKYVIDFLNDDNQILSSFLAEKDKEGN